MPVKIDVEETIKAVLEISVVVPIYNEEESIKPLYQSIRKACGLLGRPYEIIFVDDGSKDRTFEILEGMSRQSPVVKVIRFWKNSGQTAAMAAGFEHARGKIIVSMDGDLQNDPADIPRLLDKLEEGYDVVCGWRKDRQDKFWSRRVPSIIANWLIGKITGVKIHDNGCSLKAYRANVIKNISLYGEMHRFIPAMSTLTGARVTEIVVNHHPRRFGHSKYGIGRIWRVFLDIITVKMITDFSSRPGLWFGLMSIPIIAIGSIVLLFAVGLLFRGATEEWIVVSLVSFLLLSLGVHLVAMGIIAELSVRTGDYSLKESIAPTVRYE